VVSLRSKPKLLLQFFEGNGGGYEIRAFRADGSVQLIVNDDSFAYFGGLSYASSPARLPWLPATGMGGLKTARDSFRMKSDAASNHIVCSSRTPSVVLNRAK
jgi:hypothetical protein